MSDEYREKKKVKVLKIDLNISESDNLKEQDSEEAAILAKKKEELRLLRLNMRNRFKKYEFQE